ncbi:MAG: ankyrin repeat domain-containing protein [Nitrospira sp.]|nr:ankyrin repeat domain-containing protein [Nitrospira sp.]
MAGLRSTLLLAETDHIDQRNGSGRTALYEASQRGQTSVMALLLQHRANPNAKTTHGYTDPPPILQTPQ